MATFRTRTATTAAARHIALNREPLTGTPATVPVLDTDTHNRIAKLLERAYNLVPPAAQTCYESILIAQYAIAAAAAQVSAMPYDVPRECAGILAHVNSCGRVNVTDVIRGRAVTLRTVIHFTGYDVARAAAGELREQGLKVTVMSTCLGEYEVYYDAQTHADYAAARAAGVKI
jgi:hypothetical protein